MNAHASPSIEFYGDASLGGFLAALEPYTDESLVLEYAGRTIQPGFHVTEVKAGAFVTLDCGGNPDQWRETILQVEDLPGIEGRSYMAVAKFRAILDQVAARIPLAADARLTFEIGPPGEAMRVFDAQLLEPQAERVVLRLASRSAICKPRQRAAQAAAVACCGPRAKSAGYCG